MTVEQMIEFRDKQRQRGLDVTDDFNSALAHIGYVEAHDHHYRRLNRLQRWWHRRNCSGLSHERGL